MQGKGKSTAQRRDYDNTGGAEIMRQQTHPSDEQLLNRAYRVYQVVEQGICHATEIAGQISIPVTQVRTSLNWLRKAGLVERVQLYNSHIGMVDISLNYWRLPHLNTSR
jgi:predicted Rossmann fold nucleotide-binding protein DprA/Smf involved in DNA uptake